VRALPVLVVAFASVAVLAGCDRPREPAGRRGDGSRIDSAATPSTDVPPDTSRAGPAFVAVYRDGPLDELRVVRATDGRLVVAGEAEFPDGTQVTVSLLTRRAGGALEPVASGRARVEAGRFMGPPLSGVGGPPPPGLHVLRVSAPFGPGDQDPGVLRAAAGGRRFHGSGVREHAGRIVFETTLEVPL
jgi:hypothetical protein